MRTALALALASVLVASGAGAVDNCFDCLIGIYDDPALTEAKGTITVGVTKDVYVGAHLAAGENGLTGIEISIAGLNKDGLLVVGTEPLGPRALVWGNTIAAPVDTTETSTGDGGITAAWSLARNSGDALLKVTLLATQEIENHLLVVKRSYPTSNPSWRTPAFTRTDSPVFTAVRASGGCYALNATGGLLSDCATISRATPVASRTWSGVKRLYQ